MKLLIMQPRVAYFLLGPNILLSTLFSDAFNLYFSLKMKYQVSHPYKTTDKLITT
jgi:hypothetical protein